MPQNILSNTASNYVADDSYKVIVTDANDAPETPVDGGISPSTDETGFWIQSSEGFEIKFKYADNTGSSLTYVQEDNQHNIVIDQSNAQAGVQVPWLEHQLYGKPTFVYFIGSQGQSIVVLKVTSAINHDSDFKDGGHDLNFLSFHSNSVKMGTVGKAYATQTTTNEFGYRAIRHDNTILNPAENIEVVVDGIVDYIAVLMNDVKNIDTALDKDIENERTTIMFTVPDNYDNQDSSNSIVTWYSVGRNVENLEFEIYVGDGSNDGTANGLSSDFYFRTTGHDTRIFGDIHGGETTPMAIATRGGQQTATNWDLFKWDFTVDWGDGTIEAFDAMVPHQSGGEYQSLTPVTYSHTYASAGYYKISIGGKPQALNFGALFGEENPLSSSNPDILNALKIRNLTQWGTHKWKTFPMFKNCAFMDITATDQPQLFGSDDYVDPDGNIVFINGVWDSNIEPGNTWENYTSPSLEGCTLLRNKNNSIANWDLGNIFNKDVYGGNNLTNIFKGCKLYAPINFNNWVTYWNDNSVKVTAMASAFEGCESFNGDVSNWPVEIIENQGLRFQKVFKGCKLFNQDLSNWDVSSVTNMTSVFEGCESFNQDLSQWNVSNNLIFKNMFKGCTIFNQDLSNWTNSNSISVQEMFSGCEAFTNGGSDLPTWTVNNAKGTFKDCLVFSPSNDINWTTDTVTSLEETFMNCKTINLYKVRYWNTSNVTEFRSCFEGCDNTPSGGNTYPVEWDITKARSLNRMFFNSNMNTYFPNWDFSQLGQNYVNSLNEFYANAQGVDRVYSDGTENTAKMLNYQPFPYAGFWNDGSNWEIEGWMKNFVGSDHSDLFYQQYDQLLVKLATELPDLNLVDGQAGYEVAQIDNNGLGTTVNGTPWYGRIGMGQSQRSATHTQYYETIREKGWLLTDGGTI